MELDKDDIQGLIVSGYPQLRASEFLLLVVEDAAKARAYLRSICARDADPRDRVTNASTKPTDVALHVAFTRWGLEKLDVPARAVASFSREFVEGMDDEVRARALGDHGPNHPSTWTWTERPHVLLMLYATGKNELAAFSEEQRAAFAGGLRVVATKPCGLLAGDREHFGWKDGISSPIMEGLGATVRSDPDQKSKAEVSWTFPFKPGEFILGYENEYGAYTEGPSVDLVDDPLDVLPACEDATAKDLGRNGTYLVYREMTQNVRTFWKYLHEESREDGADRAAQAITLGAKMVGRWPGGASLVDSATDDPAMSNVNDFTFYLRDKQGLKCPLGSHIRRANPRDQLHSDRDDHDSDEMVRKHQMLRRGRVFGEPLVESMQPRDVLALSEVQQKTVAELAEEETERPERGLHFIALVGHIGRQFEFVQRAWVSSPNFAALFKDGDPMIGARRTAAEPNTSDEFTCPAVPLRRKYKGMPAFTRVVGGAYFFLPGLQALRYIARGEK